MSPDPAKILFLCRIGASNEAASGLEGVKQRDPGKKSFETRPRVGRDARLNGTDDGVAMPLSHHADLTAVRARSRTDVALDHGAVALLHHHRAEFTALAGRRLVAPRACPLREDPLERLPELSVEDAVDYRVEGRVTVAEPRENLFGKRRL